MDKRFIYGLHCPFTNDIHYIGKTTIGMIRPLEHLTESHSLKVKEWVNSLKEIGHSPIVKIIETVSIHDNLDFRERYWIQYYVNKKALLLNINLVSPILIKHNLDELLGKGDVMARLSKFVKEKRKQNHLTQVEFAVKAGVALTVIRKIEQNKTNYQLNGLLQILKMFGCSIEVCRL